MTIHFQVSLSIKGASKMATSNDEPSIFSSNLNTGLLMYL